MKRNMKLAEKLVHLRKEKDLSQYDVASTLNVSRQAISRWESGSIPIFLLIGVIKERG